MILPWATTPRTIALHEIPGKTIALSTIAPEFPLRTTIENCFELSHLEFELHLSKASIVIGYLRGHVNLSLELRPFSTFFIVAVLLSQEVKMNFF